MINMFHPYISNEARRNVQETLITRWIGEGPRVKLFEDRLELVLGVDFALALCNGTAGLRLALAMCNVGPGDEVITTAQTCTATNMPILEQFATPVFADIQYCTGNIDPQDIEHRITDKTKAIIVVHWAGYPCDLDEIHRIAHYHGLPVIEDAAHALGASYKGQPIGTISAFTMFSFQAIKQLTCGDGGLLTVLTQEHYDEARRRRWFGIDRENRVKQQNGYSHWPQTEAGYKYHMNDIAAAIGLGNLQDLDYILGMRARIAEQYTEALTDVSGVYLFGYEDDRVSGNWLFTMHVDCRNDFCAMMDSNGIETSVCHVRNDSHPIFGPQRDDLPNVDRYAETNISIPLHNHLAEEDVEYIIDVIRGGW